MQCVISAARAKVWSTLQMHIQYNLEHLIVLNVECGTVSVLFSLLFHIIQIWYRFSAILNFEFQKCNFDLSNGFLRIFFKFESDDLETLLVKNFLKSYWYSCIEVIVNVLIKSKWVLSALVFKYSPSVIVCFYLQIIRSGEHWWPMCSQYKPHCDHSGRGEPDKPDLSEPIWHRSLCCRWQLCSHVGPETVWLQHSILYLTHSESYT